jgi:hypothetical protein
MHEANLTAVCRDYEKLLLYIEEQDMLEVDSVRPFMDGNSVREALDVPKGPGIARAMELVVEWQVRNPGNQEVKEAISWLAERKGELDVKRSK